MNTMDRCEKHKLMRCAICMRPAASLSPAPLVVNVPAGSSFSPEDALDGPQQPNVQTSAPEVDKQALEAIERNKAIGLAGSTIVTDTVIEESFPWPNPKTSAGVFHPDPPFQVQPRGTVESNPIVNAAAIYAEAQKRVEATVRQIANLKLQLENAETMQAEAVADRDVKKSVLQKLVAE